MSSVSQIVRKIIDDLSDGVSELVLLVVVLAEQNAALPDQLPPAAEVVNSTANTLAKIARQLGATDYKEYPEIYNEINEAADAVDAATSTMRRATNILQGPGDRKQGWNGLVDGCRIMSGKTIRLLQIVYGADLKRLQLTADNLDDLLNNLDSHNDLRNPNNQKRFANEVPQITNKALQMANFLRDRANDTDSPFAKELLGQIAKNLGDKAQKLVDAGNKALRNPDLAPLVDEAIQELKDEIKRAKDALRDTDAEPKSLGKLRDLMPLLDQAEEAVAAIPAAVKDPAKFERAQQKEKDDVGAVLRQIKPNPKLARDASKIDDGLKNHIIAAHNALRNPNNPEANKALDKATNDLLDALGNLRKANQDKPLTPEQKEEFQKALENLKKVFGEPKKPEDKEQEKYDRLKDNIEQLKNALRNNDPKAAAPALKRAAQGAKELAEDMRKNAPKLPPYQRQRKEEAANDLDNLIPKLIKKGSPAVRNMNEPEKEDLMDALRKLKRAADRGNQPKDERDMGENWRDMLKGLQKTNKDAGDGKRNEIDPGLKAIRDALDNLKRGAERMADRHPNPQEVLKPIADMEKLFDQYKGNAPSAASGNAPALKTMEDLIPKFEKAWDDLNKPVRVKDIHPIQDVEDAIDRVGGAVDTNEPHRIVPAGKDLAQKIEDLGRFVQSLPDPKLREFGDDVYNQLKPDLRDLLTKAKEAAQNPDKPGIADEFNDIVYRMKEPLAELKKRIDPKPFDRTPEAAAAEVKKNIEGLRNAQKGKDPQQIQKAIDGVKDSMKRFADVSDEAVTKLPDPRKRKILEPILHEAHELADDARRLDPFNDQGIKNLMDQIPDNIDKFFDNFRNDAKDDAINAMAKINNLVANLGSIDDDDMDLGDLLGTAGELSNLMRGLIGDTANTARKLGVTEKSLSSAAQAALDLDKLLTRIDGGDVEESHQIVNLTPLLTSTINEEAFERIDLKKARTFDQIAAAIAYEIHEQAKAISKEADDLAFELANLAKAARSGNKQMMLLSAKAASAHIIAFCKQLTDLAARIPGRTMAEKKEQDNLIRYAQGLRNYGTQLKILTSVKAASIEESRDTDASLAEMTRCLGDVVKASLNSMVTTKNAILLKQ